MKRDIDLARAILLALEECDSSTGFQNFEVQGATSEQVSYHVKLLYQAGLIDAIDASAMNSFQWYPESLTWNGHEFLDASRDETIWNNAKKHILDNGGVIAFDVLKAVLIHLSKKSLGLIS